MFPFSYVSNRPRLTSSTCPRRLVLRPRGPPSSPSPSFETFPPLEDQQVDSIVRGGLRSMPCVYGRILRVARVCAHHHFPAVPTLEVLVPFSGSDSTVNIMRRFFHLQPLQMHHPHLRRPVPSRQSACHHPLMHSAPHNRRHQTRSEECDEANMFAVFPRTPIDTWAFECFSVRPSLDDATWRKCSACVALGASSLATIFDTSTYVPFRCHECIYAKPILVRPSHCELPTPRAPV